MTDVRAEAIVIAVIGITGVGAAIAAVVRWGGLPFADPPTERTLTGQVQWWARLVTVTMLTAIVSGVLVPGLGGRLAMRLIAATAGERAQGRLTEADELVGVVTLDGTIGFIVFVGLGAGILGAFSHLVLRPVLPSGRLGGAIFAAFALVLVATRIDPLRADNPDFDLVGPDPLAVVIFGALPVLLGLTIAAVAARVSHAVPLIDRSPRTWLPYLALVPALLVPSLFAILIVAGAITIAIRLTPSLRNLATSPRATTAARIAIAVVAVIALPGFATSIADIVSG